MIELVHKNMLYIYISCLGQIDGITIPLQWTNYQSDQREHVNELLFSTGFSPRPPQAWNPFLDVVEFTLLSEGLGMLEWWLNASSVQYTLFFRLCVNSLDSVYKHIVSRTLLFSVSHYLLMLAKLLFILIFKAIQWPFIVAVN